jgi:hypothetical protein
MQLRLLFDGPTLPFGCKEKRFESFVFPNLDFKPTYKILLLETKVQNHFLFLQELAIKINLELTREEKRSAIQKPSPQ